MTTEDRAQQIVKQMLAQDRFSTWLGLKVKVITPGHAVVQMTVRDEMLNGFNVCHGGITFSLADSALAFASNAHGQIAMSVENSIAYPASIVVGDVLTAVATEISKTARIGVYNVLVTKADQTVVGVFRGTVYRTEKTF